MAALRAGHVHAAVVLLDGPLALGARFGVGQDPVEVLALRAVLQQPLRDRGAVHLQHRATRLSCQDSVSIKTSSDRSSMQMKFDVLDAHGQSGRTDEWR